MRLTFFAVTAAGRRFFIGIAAALLQISFVAAAQPGMPMEIKSLEAPGLHNVFALGTNILSGSSPEGDEGFETLVKLGVKTILTVDGTSPDLERARRYGMRYVHLPHGYDGISSNIQMQLVKAVTTLPGPFYVHCHHGKHRGPAAVAVVCMATHGWSSNEAEAWLHAAGTATNYSGLYQVVREFRRPTSKQLDEMPAEFPELAKVSGLVDAMVDIDGRWDHLKAVRAAGYQAPRNHPDLQPANEAVILWEHYREAQRLPDATQRGTDFVERLRAAETEAREAEGLLREFASTGAAGVRERLDKTFDSMGRTCASCHKTHRD